MLKIIMIHATTSGKAIRCFYEAKTKSIRYTVFEISKYGSSKYLCALEVLVNTLETIATYDGPKYLKDAKFVVPDYLLGKIQFEINPYTGCIDTLFLENLLSLQTKLKALQQQTGISQFYSMSRSEGLPISYQELRTMHSECWHRLRQCESNFLELA